MAVKESNCMRGREDVQYEGCVLNMWERNGYEDSDFYAVCWSEKDQKVIDVCYDTTRCGGYGTAEIDATDEVVRKAYRYYFDCARKWFDDVLNPNNAKEVKKGDNVVVVRGRKVPKGTIGKVFWLGSTFNQYSNRFEKRAGIETENGRVFVPADYLEKIDWQKDLITGKDRKAEIRRLAIGLMPNHYRDRFETKSDRIINAWRTLAERRKGA